MSTPIGWGSPHWCCSGLGAFILFSVVSIGSGSLLDSILRMTQSHMDLGDQQQILDAHWQFAHRTYGLHRPDDLRTPGTVVPWQLFPIDSTRAQSSHRALAYPSYVMISHDDFASFEQRPHGLMEVVVPGDSWLVGTVLPWRVNWPILREFIAPGAL